MDPSAPPSGQGNVDPGQNFASSAQQFLSTAIQWSFLDEPIWRWFVFIIVMGALLSAWNGVLRHMKSA